MIIKSILDIDFYKLVMQQFMFFNHRNVTVSYSFDCRNKDIDLTPDLEEIKKEILELKDLRLTLEEKQYLKTLDCFKDKYLDFLENLRLQPELLDISDKDGKLSIELGTVNNEVNWVETTLFEIYILAIVNEVYFRKYENSANIQVGIDKLSAKILLIEKMPEDFKIMEFGTRRRFNTQWQEFIYTRLLKTNRIIGTSNVYLAMKNNQKPRGTKAHEIIMAYQSLRGLDTFQRDLLKEWMNFYQDKFKIALSDTIGTKAFIEEIGPELLSQYDGLRHDSGNPIVWGEYVLSCYQKNNIDARNKTLIFSDGLNVPKAIEIYNHFKERTNIVFGIGTDLTNDLSVKALSIVYKLSSCQGKYVAKISDEPNKMICKDKNVLGYLLNRYQELEPK